MKCPTCLKRLETIQVPTTKLWVWPGEWPNGSSYSPMIGLIIFSAADVPKGEVHQPTEGRYYMFHHVWIGDDDTHREEKLILLDKQH